MAVCGRGGVDCTDLCCAEAAEEAVGPLKTGKKICLILLVTLAVTFRANTVEGEAWNSEQLGTEGRVTFLIELLEK